MSAFIEKIRRGIVPTEQEWEAHLIEVHAKQPSMTPEAFAAFATAEGLSSYEILGRELHGGETHVVDLACGDGYLLPLILKSTSAKVSAVDMSREGIELAKQKYSDPRIDFIIARAQKLPFADGSVDHVLCHMAFMLMSPVEPVVSELRRVLKPGGRFSAVIGSGEVDGFYKKVRRLVSIFVQAHIPRFNEARVGSAAVREPAGLNELFAEGFQVPVRVEPFYLRYHVTPVGVWDYLHNMYYVPMFTESVRREFQDELQALVRDHLDSEGKVQFNVPMKLISVSRR